ncbi:sugar kinase [Deinococcus cellulosilyticus]|uniref:Fructokinase-like protein n=1 Tax=Deinococcus cellulosilyticus (strain DSM 18568 / NBRC 106333 / KACC 11606 / 5516J-15) TaxID=1223518 RepID=A0A511N1H6_DEIC1|nr:sugar kinase [Deinococcus cellulosilyticus]GEM46301.1 fructokinase-like protein [Deinococcus cellulosilyticus NBRC 106333 = KACC 11606]
MKALDLIGIGECMVECHADQPLGTTPTLKRSFGGDVLNTLVTASRLGLRTGFVSRVGDDPFGPGLIASWEEEGIDTTHAPLVPGENGIYFISLLEGGEREFTYRRAGSAASKLQSEHLDPSYLASARMLLVSGITQAISESARKTVLEAVKMARSFGVQVVYDPNFRPRLWESQGGLEAARTAFEEVLPMVDLLLPSFPADLTFLEPSVQNQHQALDVLSALHPFVVLKSGEDGAFYHHAGAEGHIPALPVDQVMDTTGAGDCWNGAFLTRFLQSTPLPEAIQFAHRVAARKLAFRGAIPPKDLFGAFHLEVQ